MNKCKSRRELQDVKSDGSTQELIINLVFAKAALADALRAGMQVMPGMGEAGSGQAVVVGDHRGVLQSFYFLRGEYKSVYKHLPTSHQVNSIVAGNGRSQAEKNFVAEGCVVRSPSQWHVARVLLTTGAAS